MDFLGILDLVNKMGEAKRIGTEMIEPASQMMNDAREGLGSFLGTTKEIEYEDGRKDQVFDKEAFNERMEGVAKTGAGLAQFDKMMKPGVVQATPMAPMQQVPMSQAYAPVNYGQMPAQGMFGQQPTYEQLLKALQSRGY